MRNNNQTKRWLPAAVFGVLVAVLLFPSHKVQGAQAGIDAVVSAAAQILYHNERGSIGRQAAMAWLAGAFPFADDCTGK